jgi:hypothetical protein
LNGASLNATIEGRTAQGSVVSVTLALVWEGKGNITRQASPPQKTRAGGARPIRGENLSRNAVVTGTVDRRDISDAMVDASLRRIRETISR